MSNESSDNSDLPTEKEVFDKIKSFSIMWKFRFYGFFKNLKFFEPYLMLLLLANEYSFFQIGILFLILFILLVIGIQMSFVESDSEILSQFEQHQHSKYSAEIKYLAHQKTTVRYLISGDTSAKIGILFIHGAPGGLGMFVPYHHQKVLNERYTLISVDRPGYGYSTIDPMPSIIEQSKIINEIIKLNPSKKFILFGHSYGGPIAGYIGYLNPDQIVHSILAGGAVDPEQEKFVWTGVLCNLPGIYHISSNDTKTATKEKLGHKSALNEIENSWEDLQVRVTAMHGDKDWMVPFENIHFLEERIDEGLLEINQLIGDDHFFFTDIPLVTNAIVKVANLYNQGD